MLDKILENNKIITIIYQCLNNKIDFLKYLKEMNKINWNKVLEDKELPKSFIEEHKEDLIKNIDDNIINNVFELLKNNNYISVTKKGRFYVIQHELFFNIYFKLMVFKITICRYFLSFNIPIIFTT